MPPQVKHPFYGPKPGLLQSDIVVSKPAFIKCVPDEN